MSRYTDFDPSLNALLHAATLAPSGDNTQPWRFEADAAQQRLVIRVDGSRDRSPMNAGDRMARIACGAALENIRITAGSSRAGVEIDEYAPDAIQLRMDGHFPTQIPPIVLARATNRRIYSGKTISASDRREVERLASPQNGVRALWICDDSQLEQHARIIGRTDALMFAQRAMRRAFLANVNFSTVSGEEPEEGLSLASLEVSRGQSLALRALRHIPDALFNLGPARMFAAQAAKLVRSASGLCIVVAPDRSPETDFLVGQVAQRAWLALTARGFAAQPMMSPLVLSNALEHGDVSIRDALSRAEARALLDEFTAAIPELGPDRPAFLLRFGIAQAPSGRTGRLAPVVKPMLSLAMVDA